MLWAALAAALAPSAFPAPAPLPVAPSVLPLAVPLDVFCSNPPPGNLARSGAFPSAVPRDPCGTGRPFVGGPGSLVSAYWDLGDQFYGATANYEREVGDGSLDLTPTNDPLRAAYANTLPAADFEASNSEYLTSATNVSPQNVATTNDFTISFWYNPESVDGTTRTVFKGGTGVSLDDYWIAASLTSTAFTTTFSHCVAGGFKSVTSAAPSAGTWYHVLVYNDEAGLEHGVIINGGTPDTTAAFDPARNICNAAGLTFGTNTQTSPTLFYDGRVSNFAYWPSLLSSAEQADLYNNGVPVPCRNLPAIVDDALETCYDLSELSGNRSDFTANAVTLTDNASVLHGSGPGAPRAYRAAQFTAASSEYLSRADEPQLSVGDVDWAFWVWVRADSFSGENAIAGKMTSGSFNEYDWLLSRTTTGSALRLDVDTTTATAGSVTTGSLTAGEWNLAYAEHDATGDTIGLSLNGAAVTTAAWANGFDDSTFPFEFGRQGTTGRFWDGQMASAAWLRGDRLTAAEIAKLYAGGAAFSCDTIPSDIPTPTLCWDLDEPSGTRSASIGNADLTDHSTVLSGDGIADIPGGVTLRAADFESSNSEYLSATNALNSGQTDASWGWWWKWESLATSATLAGLGDSLSAGNVAWRVFIQNTALPNIGMQMWNGTGNHERYANNIVAGLGVWGNAVFVLDGDGPTSDIFINGVDVPSTAANTAPTSVLTGETVFNIGAFGNGLAGTFHDGLVGQFVIWNATLTATQAALYYNSGDQVPCASIEAVVGVAPAYCWDLDEASGTRSASIGSVDLTDISTVLSTGGLIRGRTGHAFDLADDAGTVFTLADADPISTGDIDFSGWVWVYIDSLDTTDFIAGKITNAGAGEWQVTVTSAGTVSFEVWQGGVKRGDAEATHGTKILNQWSWIYFEHLAATDTVNVSINNGETTGTDSTTVAPSDTAIGLALGAYATTDAGMDGRTDELVFLKGATLSATQKTCVYNSGRGRSYADLQTGVCDE